MSSECSTSTRVVTQPAPLRNAAKEEEDEDVDLTLTRKPSDGGRQKEEHHQPQRRLGVPPRSMPKHAAPESVLKLGSAAVAASSSIAKLARPSCIPVSKPAPLPTPPSCLPIRQEEEEKKASSECDQDTPPSARPTTVLPTPLPLPRFVQVHGVVAQKDDRSSSDDEDFHQHKDNNSSDDDEDFPVVLNTAAATNAVTDPSPPLPPPPFVQSSVVEQPSSSVEDHHHPASFLSQPLDSSSASEKREVKVGAGPKIVEVDHEEEGKVKALLPSAPSVKPTNAAPTAAASIEHQRPEHLAPIAATTTTTAPPATTPNTKNDNVDDDDQLSPSPSLFSGTTRYFDYRCFDWLGILASGGFGDVWLAQHIVTRKQYAIKRLNKRRVELKVGPHLGAPFMYRERDVWMRVADGPYIARFYGTFQTTNSLYFVTDLYTGGTLDDFVPKSWARNTRANRVGLSDLRIWASQLVVAIAFLHSNNVAHRDLKPDNVLLDNQGRVILTDFGLAKPDNTPRTFVGTPGYIAPEVYEGGAYDARADWWSLGVLLYLMIFGRLPFPGSDRDAIERRVREGKPPKYPRGEINDSDVASKDLAIDFLQRLLCHKDVRLSLDGIKEHDFLVFDKIKRLTHDVSKKEAAKRAWWTKAETGTLPTPLCFTPKDKTHCTPGPGKQAPDGIPPSQFPDFARQRDLTTVVVAKQKTTPSAAADDATAQRAAENHHLATASGAVSTKRRNKKKETTTTTATTKHSTTAQDVLFFLLHCRCPPSHNDVRL